MILPDKHTSPERSLLAVGGLLLGQLARPITLNRLWERVRDDPIVRSYDAFTLTLAFLYSIGAVEEREGQLVRARP
jgi:hypothetical protein